MKIIKNQLPHIIALISFLLISYIYHAPLLEGKELKQHDTMVFKGMAKEGSDYRTKTGKEALWTNSMFSGMPTYLVGLSWKNNLFKKINSFIQIGPRPGSYTFITMLGMYIALLMFGANPWLSIVGAIAYGLSSYNIIILAAGHNSKAVALAYIPLVIASIHYTLHKKMWLGLAVFGLSMGLEILAGHPQITYYGFLMILIYGIIEIYISIKDKYIKILIPKLIGLGIVLILAIGSHFGNLYSTYDYGKFSIRGPSELTSNKSNQTSGLDKDYATAWSYGKLETFNLLIPNLYGGSSSADLGKDSHLYKELKKYNAPNAKQIVERAPAYWGPQPMTSGPVYIGAVIIFLFVLGLFLIKGPLKWWLLSVTIFSFLLSWGHNFMWFTNLFLDYFPGYNKFRTVSMILIIAQIAIPILAILGVDRLLKEDIKKQEFLKAFKNTLIIVGGIILIFLVFGKIFFNFSAPVDAQMFGKYNDLINALRNDRASMLTSDALRSLIFVVLTALLIWQFYNKKLKQKYFFGGLIILVLIDLWGVDKRYLNFDNFISKKKVQVPYQPTSADLQILKDKDPDFRVFNTTVSTFNDASTSYFHKSIGGYHGAKMRRYQEIIEHHISRNNMSVLNMLNTKYFIINTKLGPQAQLNPNALGNAWFVDEYKLVNNADEEIAALTNFDPKQEAIVDKRFTSDLNGLSIKKDSTASIKLLEYTPNYLRYKSINKNDGLAVFSEIYYPKGWIVKINGKETSLFRANYILRALRVPAGENIIEFSFEPKIYSIGENVSLISSLLLILFIISIFFIEIKKSVKKE